MLVGNQQCASERRVVLESAVDDPRRAHSYPRQ
jgi:hypothetical protein